MQTANSRQIELKEKEIYIVARGEDIFRSHAEQICQKLSNKLILTVGLSSDSETWFNVFARGKKNSCPPELSIFPFIYVFYINSNETKLQRITYVSNLFRYQNCPMPIVKHLENI